MWIWYDIFFSQTRGLRGGISRIVSLFLSAIRNMATVGIFSGDPDQGFRTCCFLISYLMLRWNIVVCSVRHNCCPFRQSNTNIDDQATTLSLGGRWVGGEQTSVTPAEVDPTEHHAIFFTSWGWNCKNLPQREHNSRNSRNSTLENVFFSYLHLALTWDLAQLLLPSTQFRMPEGKGLLDRVLNT